MSSKTLAYILKRIGLAILTVWVVITVTFFVMHAVRPRRRWKPSTAWISP